MSALSYKTSEDVFQGKLRALHCQMLLRDFKMSIGCSMLDSLASMTRAVLVEAKPSFKWVENRVQGEKLETEYSFK